MVYITFFLLSFFLLAPIISCDCVTLTILEFCRTVLQLNMAEFQEVSYNLSLEGDMLDNINAQEDDNDEDDALSTLDEPVKDTFVSRFMPSRVG